MFNISKYRGKKACVLGLGRSGVAAANLLARKGVKVLASNSENADVSKLKLHKNVEVELGHSARIEECAFVIKSPGISHNTAVLKKIKKKGIPVFSEVEMALSFIPKSCRIIAVTGTNGKTTTTMLTADIFKQYLKDKKSKKKVFTVGNIGEPLSDYVSEIKAGDFIIMELSSYQLEDSSYFKPHASALLNITPDHIDHHGSFKAYMAAKRKIFEHQTKGDFAVTNSADVNCLKVVNDIKSKLLCFATTPRHKVRSHVFYDGDEMIFSSGLRLKPPKLLGIHNVENAMAASLLALSMGVGPLSVQRAFNHFKGVEHRIEKFLTHKGIACIDDSKATNVDSTLIALRAMEDKKNIWLILGGKDKGFPYTSLLPLIEKKCKRVIALGEAAPKITKDLKAFKKIIPCKTIDCAVEAAFKDGKPGDVLLLSPACASFDQFKNFEERGRYFKKVCKKYAGG